MSVGVVNPRVLYYYSVVLPTRKLDRRVINIAIVRNESCEFQVTLTIVELSFLLPKQNYYV